MKKLALLALASTIGLTFGCQQAPIQSMNSLTNPALQDFSTYRAKTSAKWTIMVHMGAENNLNEFGFKDMDEMASGLNTKNIKDLNVIVLYDGMQKGDSQVFKLKPGGRDKVDDKGAIIPTSTHEVDSGSPKVANDFMQWAIKTYPAEHYMFDIWDHGAGIFKTAASSTKLKGWNGMFGSPASQSPTASFGYDDNGTHMNTRDLTNILGAAAKTAGKKIDILGFDACLMGHLEIAYQVKDSVNILVGSEELEPGDGWDYKAWLSKINSTDLSAASVATTLVTTYGQFYNGGQDATLSATDINAVATNLVPALNNLADVLQKTLPGKKDAIGKARDAAQTFYNKNCRDIGSVINNIKKANISTEVNTAATAVLNAYKPVVLKEVHATSQKSATGMVMYFPAVTDTYNTEYDNVNEILFAQQPAWGNFLKTLLKK